jgi:5'-3' exonuclease
MTITSSATINLTANKPVIIIDQSYYIFNRYYATYSWYKRWADKELDHENIENNDEFILSFFRHFENDMKKLTKKFKTVKTNIIFCIDCCRSEIWRNEIYSNYKLTRTKKTNFNSVIFNLFENYIHNYNYNYCSYERLEADDIAYLLQRKIKDEYKSMKVIIVTNDNDYLQMYDANTHIINMQMKDLTLRLKNNPITELEFKIIYGDKSDNIQKIQTGLNKDAALRLAMLPENDRNKYLNENNLFHKYQLNKQLVDLREIPKQLMEAFYNKYNITVKK